MGNISTRYGQPQGPQDQKLRSPDPAIGKTLPKGAIKPASDLEIEALQRRVSAVEARLTELEATKTTTAPAVTPPTTKRKRNQK